MSKVIDFYFDYSSPYGYLASERIEAIAAKHGCEVIWRPILLGAIFKISGQRPLTESPLKGEYAIMDISRSAREHSLSYQHPIQFPIASVASARATLWLRDNTRESLSQKTSEWIHSIYRGYFTQGLDITDLSTLSNIADRLSINSETLLEAISSQHVKDALKVEVDRAVKAGVFGSPMMIVNEEKFWGDDRLDQMERWLTGGGW